jgi:hypothetical protein
LEDVPGTAGSWLCRKEEGHGTAVIDRKACPVISLLRLLLE